MKSKTVGQSCLSAGSPDFPVRSSEGRLESRPNRQTGTSALRTAVVALRVERFNDPDELVRFMRHEFTHIDDMINPAFGYSPELDLPGRNAAQLRVARERYRLLWDITIDGRLAVAAGVRRRDRGESSSSSPPAHPGSYDSIRDSHRAAFDRAFGFWPERKRDEVFNSFWRCESPWHADLASIASDPRELQAAPHEPVPGAPCPLCGFPTFHWAAATDSDEPTRAAIRREFPQWSAEQGACGRCVQIYRVVSQHVEAAA